MRIAIGKSRFSARWKNEDWTWEQLVDRCKETLRTKETAAEYRKMTRGQRDDIKDVGGFVGGFLRNGRRKGDHVEARSLLTLDLDQTTPGIWDEITMFFDYKCMMYSTHKHTAQAPRVRLIIPFSREVTAEEYPAIARMVAKDIGIDMVDETCYRVQQLMYWPSTSIDGEFFFETQDGPMLNPDTILARYKDWRDTSAWPTSSRENTVINRSMVKQADPLTKKGIIGSFCRTYSIEAAIDKFLGDVYRPSVMEGRYDYIKGESTAGLVLYDDKFAFSHHATDPASGHLLNAFDLVRIHKFIDLDEKADPETTTTKLPSYKAMQEFASQDTEVRLQLAREREAAALQDFTDDGDGSIDWQAGLQLGKSGDVVDTLTNFVLILKNDPRLKAIAYNEHRCGIDIRSTDNLPWTPLKAGWSDADLASLSAYVDRVYHIYSPSKLKSALLTVTAERSFHPIKEYFDSLPEWDGINRIDTLLTTYLGAEDSSYTRAVMRKTLVAAVARIYEPGIKFDTILVLAGDQGIGKSTFFARLAGTWFSDSLSIADMRDKTGPEKLQGFWILEISEMNGIKKVDVETVKSFASRQDDKYRVAYGIVVESHPRQCIIVGTTNTMTGFLRDVTGNRRFWPVTLTGTAVKHPWDLTKADVAQIWAEALVLYNSGEELILRGEEAALAIERQQDALENDDREGLVREYLDKLLPADWGSMSLSQRRTFLAGDEFDQSPNAGCVRRERVCNVEIWAECFGKDPATITKQDSYSIASIMKKIDGWDRYNGNKYGKLSFALYGSQVAYVRSSMEMEEEELPLS